VPGEALLATEHSTWCFFSTTQFSAFQLGPRWRRRFGIPYVLDYQDPWINDYYRRTRTHPPGGRLKFALSQWVARRIEPDALRLASGIIAVSDSTEKRSRTTIRGSTPAACACCPSAPRSPTSARSRTTGRPGRS